MTAAIFLNLLQPRSPPMQANNSVTLVCLQDQLEFQPKLNHLGTNNLILWDVVTKDKKELRELDLTHQGLRLLSPMAAIGTISPEPPLHCIQVVVQTPGMLLLVAANRWAIAEKFCNEYQRWVTGSYSRITGLANRSVQ